MRWQTRTTAFAWTRDEGRLLVVRHERDGRARWEVPGGHVEGGESCEDAAARETLEETGLEVVVGDLLATCVHEWHERRRRRLITFFAAVPARAGATVVPTSSEAEIHRVDWMDPAALPRDEVSALLHPVLDHARRADGPDAGPPLHFRAEHRRAADGTWGPWVLD